MNIHTPTRRWILDAIVSVLGGVLIGALAIGAALAAAGVDIDQVNQKFSKSSVSIAAGDTVNFHNMDTVTHNINVIDANAVPEDQGLQDPGQTITKTFKLAGQYQIRCAIHPRMKMTVTVE